MESTQHDDPAAELEALAHGLRSALRRRRSLGRTTTPRTRAAEAPARPPEGAAGPAPGALARPGTGETPRLRLPDAPGTSGARTPASVPPPPRPARKRAEAPELQAAEARAAEVRERARGCADLATLAGEVATCRACGLCETRTQTVFADGSGKARIVFVGEAPGADEDASGVPFVGRAGQLLTDIITKGMGLAREDVYIANVLKCRPPGNRDPSPAEKRTCTPWLDRQLALLAPEVVVPLGRHAANHLLGTDLSMGRLRGQVHERNGIKIVPTFHPAYLLRSPGQKKECWKDIQLAMDLLGIRPPAPRPPRAG